MTFELEKLGTPGDAAGETNGRHDSFGSSVGEAHALGVGNNFLQHLGDFQFDRRRGGEVGAGSGGFGDRFDDFGMRVAEWQRAESHHPVDVFVAVDIEDAGAASAVHEYGMFAEGDWAAGRGTTCLDQDTERALVNLLRLFRGVGQIRLRYAAGTAAATLRLLATRYGTADGASGVPFRGQILK